jgi:hypothetical protein
MPDDGGRDNLLNIADTNSTLAQLICREEFIGGGVKVLYIIIIKFSDKRLGSMIAIMTIIIIINIAAAVTTTTTTTTTTNIIIINTRR